jgi:hypothetical protein
MTRFLAGRKLVIVVAVVAALTAAAVVTAAALVVTGGSSKPAAAPTTTTTTVPPSTTTTTTAPPQTTTTTTTAAPPPTPSTTAGAPACAPADLAISLGAVEGATGHEEFVLLFTNTGPAHCQVGSYPGVDADLPDGHQVAAVRTLSGFIGGQKQGGPVVPVDLAPGGVASAMVEYTDNPAAGACVQVSAYDVTPPNTTATSRLAAPQGSTICGGLQVHPILPGSTGRSGA